MLEISIVIISILIVHQPLTTLLNLISSKIQRSGILMVSNQMRFTTLCHLQNTDRWWDAPSSISAQRVGRKRDSTHGSGGLRSRGEPEGRADWLNCSTYDKAYVFIWLPGGQHFLSCLIQIAAFVLQASFNLPLLLQQPSPVSSLLLSEDPQASRLHLVCQSKDPGDTLSALHPFSHCLPLFQE